MRLQHSGTSVAMRAGQQTGAALALAAALLTALIAGEEWSRERADCIRVQEAAREVMNNFCSGTRTLDERHGGLVDCRRAHLDAHAWPSLRALRTVGGRYTPRVLTQIESATWFLATRSVGILLAVRAVQAVFPGFRFGRAAPVHTRHIYHFDDRMELGFNRS